MAVPTDSRLYAIPVQMNWNPHVLAKCASPAMAEILETASPTIDLPASLGDNGVTVSTEDNNLIQVDGNGALYAPAPIVLPLTEQTMLFPAATPTGTPVTMTFGVPSVGNTNLAFPDLIFEILPYGSPVRPQRRRWSGGNLEIDFYRDLELTGGTPVYTDVTIRGSGKILLLNTAP
jgi:hypothetical protein